MGLFRLPRSKGCRVSEKLSRLESFCLHTEGALKEFRRIVVERDDEKSRGALAADLAADWKRLLGKNERLFMISVATLAADDEDLAEVAEALDRDIANRELDDPSGMMFVPFKLRRERK